MTDSRRRQVMMEVSRDQRQAVLGYENVKEV